MVYLAVLSKEELEMSISKYDLKRLELYSQNMADYHLIMDLLPALARLHFLYKVKLQFSAAQSVGYVFYHPRSKGCGKVMFSVCQSTGRRGPITGPVLGPAQGGRVGGGVPQNRTRVLLRAVRLLRFLAGGLISCVLNNQFIDTSVLELDKFAPHNLIS